MTHLGRMSVELFILSGIVLVTPCVPRVALPSLYHLVRGGLLGKLVITVLAVLSANFGQLRETPQERIIEGIVLRGLSEKQSVIIQG